MEYTCTRHVSYTQVTPSLVVVVTTGDAFAVTGLTGCGVQPAPRSLLSRTGDAPAWLAGWENAMVSGWGNGVMCRRAGVLFSGVISFTTTV